MADEQAYYIESHEVVDDSDDEYRYEEVPIDDEVAGILEEDLDTALRAINEGKTDETLQSVSTCLLLLRPVVHLCLGPFSSCCPSFTIFTGVKIENEPLMQK